MTLSKNICMLRDVAKKCSQINRSQLTQNRPNLKTHASVFKGSVQSGFLPQKRATVDRNQSRTDPDIEGTEPNHLGPVFCGP
ncbi:uncharacterized protein LACBIDRAFT_315324 [Laccaria bicolor S238N-H82]|uniref:Predicted protein n=1 Tax=Laccaria bicolor (strain S238N-H82 / ATCC MYA-4686) TaxID=486041 RepID=B0D250_LACBS|nr:uncharacterized protein LACBIDRAFT_315324 [Laccaria bicolor S238N-H82]EDR10684.1 predicted protein [Laccaria bicolor S238N-H82]|eukprot:XP_001877985.1 predicted protein [Laccaria bicolor S238N-H82]